MGVFTDVSLEEARSFAADYDEGPLEALEGVPAGSVNSNFRANFAGKALFLRVYEEQGPDGAAREADLLRTLVGEGVATPAPLARRDGKTLGTLAGKPAALFPWTAGSIRCQASVRGPDLAEVGRQLARIHAASDRLPQNPGRFGEPQLRERIARIALAKDPTLAVMAPVLARDLDDVARRVAAEPGDQGLVHGDLFRDNVLWSHPSEPRLAALLDFESASRGSFAFDAMVTVLAWCFGDAFDPELARAFFRGYEEVRPLSPADRRALPGQGRFAALRFTITRITDYAMRETTGPRVVKDWRRFRERFDALADFERDPGFDSLF